MSRLAPPRAVLDTSALVPVWSRLLLSELAAVRPHLYTPIWCEWIVAETWRVLTVQRLRGRSTITPEDERRLAVTANTKLLNLLPVMKMVSVAPPFLAAWPTATDTSDEPIWTAAVRSGAAFVISHNLRDFPPRNQAGYCAHEGIEYITPENFVSSMLALDLDAVAPLPVLPRHRVRHERHV